MEPPEGVGERIRKRRRELNLAQQDLAGEGVTASYVSFIESGKRQPSARALSRIADRLGVSVDYLVADRDREQRRDADLDVRFAELALANGDAADAEARFRALLAAKSTPDVVARARHGLAATLETLGRLEEAIEQYEELRSEALRDGSDVSLLRVATALSRVYREAGDLGRSVEVAEGAVDRLRATGLQDSDTAVELLCTLAFAHHERGDSVRTKQLLARVRRLADGLGAPRARGAAYWNASVLASELGDTGGALTLAERALALFGEGDDERNLSRLRNAYGTLLMRHDHGQAPEALRILLQAREALLRLGTSVDVAYCETEISRALALTGQPDAAVDYAVSAIDRLGPGDRLEAPRARLALAYALAAGGQQENAVAEYRAAARELEALGAQRQAAMAYAELCTSLDHVGDTAGALVSAKRALALVSVSSPFRVVTAPSHSVSAKQG